MPFFSAKQINRVVWGVFRVLRWAFACGCARWFFVLIAFMLWVRFLIVFVAFCCCLLCFGVFLGFCCCFGGFIDVVCCLLAV